VVRVGILGPLEVWRDGAAVDVGGGRLRALLARLALDAGATVSTAALTEAVWGDDPPADPGNALQTLVSRLRRSLGDGGLVRQVAGGYRLAVEPDAVDAHRFERLARAGRDAVHAGELERGARLLREALTLWRGPALVDVADHLFATAPAARLTDLHRSALEDRIEADLALGRAREVVPELAALVGEHPLDERLSRQLIVALHQAGRQAEALAAYQRLRTRLADDLGLDPSPETQAAHLAVLRGEAPAAEVAPGPAEDRVDRSAPAARTNLRAQLSSFVGREEEVERVRKLLAESRLVTLVGPGGAGKTRLASEAAARWVDETPDGVWLIELAPVTDPALLPSAMLSALGLRDGDLLERRSGTALRDPTARLLDALAERRCVLVLDNCEHLIGPIAELVDLLLARCPQLRALATSREPLGLVGESLSIVPPLGMPATEVAAAEALAYPAVKLFADRAGAAQPGFSVDDRTIAPVLEICRRLDGMPLAIELAAARLRTLPVENVAARLNDRFRLLTGGSRVALPRHRTLRAVVEWSLGLLTEPERRLAERVAVFPAGVTPTGAETVCAGDDLPVADVFDLLAALVDKSLLQVAPPVGGEPRYRMLETLREYGLERLAERGELARTRAAHARYFIDFADVAEPHLRSAEQLQWLALLDAERDNIVAALRYLSDAGDAAGALRLAWAFGTYWMMLGLHAEVANWLRLALAVPGEVDPDDRVAAEATYLINALLCSESEVDVSEQMRELADLGERLEAVDTTARPLLALLKPLVAFMSHQPELFQRTYQAALRSPDRWVRAMALMLSAGEAENSSDIDRLRTDVAAAIDEFRVIGDRWGLSASLTARGRLLTLEGDLPGAVACYQEASELVGALGAHGDRAMMALWIADLWARQGDFATARAELRRAEDLVGETGTVHHMFFIRAAAASMARLSGDLAEADRLQRVAAREVGRFARSHPVHGHGQSVVISAGAVIAVAMGDMDRAEEQLREGYPTALSTRDMPIMAGFGLAVTDWLRATGRPERAAETLGMVARLAGSDDPTNLDVQRLTAKLRSALGADRFTSAYERGKALEREAAIAGLDPATAASAAAG
jgi:predicted ATPase/DNA-binding SARP family transcriptional activator